MPNFCHFIYLLLQMACASVVQRLVEDEVMTEEEEEEEALLVLEESDYFSDGLLLTTEPLNENISEESEVKELSSKESSSNDLPEFNRPTLLNPEKEQNRDDRDDISQCGKKWDALRQPLHETEAVQQSRQEPEPATETDAVLKQTENDTCGERTTIRLQNPENEMQILQKISSSTAALRQKLSDLVSQSIENRNRVNISFKSTNVILGIRIRVPYVVIIIMIDDC